MLPGKREAPRPETENSSVSSPGAWEEIGLPAPSLDKGDTVGQESDPPRMEGASICERAGERRTCLQHHRRLWNRSETKTNGEHHQALGK